MIELMEKEKNKIGNSNMENFKMRRNEVNTAISNLKGKVDESEAK
jgi:hypothetical protein